MLMMGIDSWLVFDVGFRAGLYVEYIFVRDLRVLDVAHQKRLPRAICFFAISSYYRSCIGHWILQSGSENKIKLDFR